jgi:acyl transferase domain-containing protein/NAD(P)H-dependent flavin oxidoreductase YrpB (nitropropane dioxygenase family)
MPPARTLSIREEARLVFSNSRTPFAFFASTLPACSDPAIAIACSRAGGCGVCDLTFTPDLDIARASLAQLTRYTTTAFAVRVKASDETFLRALSAAFPDRLSTIILTIADPAELAQAVTLLRPLGRTLLLECISVDEGHLGLGAGVDGLIAKGHEAGGRVGHETTFILLQQFLQTFPLPVYVQGGIGPHAAAGCCAAGAAGVVLDGPVALTRESPLPDAIRRRMGQLEGRETTLIGESLGRMYRVWSTDSAVIANLATVERELAGQGSSDAGRLQQWDEQVARHVNQGDLLLLGQDIGFARSLAERYVTVAGVLQAMESTIDQSRLAAANHPILAEQSPLARAHATRFPVVQGPMARVSDTPAFAHAVVREGALPFLAVAWLREQELDRLLQETANLLKDRAWGVGLLGFLPAELYAEQRQVVCRHKPPFALIAGGRPGQVKDLEQEGIATYVHVPTLGLLTLFLEAGLTRFVFEGREAGGHVGPLSSLVLWETMIAGILRHVEAKGRGERYHLLFAGGISDGRSAAFVAAMAAPLAEHGVRIGLQLGSGYLFTEEAVASGAILPRFQEEILRCRGTVLLESGPGHAVRCAETPFTHVFRRERQQLLARGVSNRELRERLELLERGRLRIATKGLQVNPQYRQIPDAPRLIPAQEGEQVEQGEYMIGELAALHSAPCTIAGLHSAIIEDGGQRIGQWGQRSFATSQEGRAQHPSDIAIIGMSCFLPQAQDVTTYWSNIVSKVNTIREIPKERWDWERYFSPDPEAPDQIYAKWGAFLDDIPFDPLRYGMPPKVLASVEPLHLISLETARLALEDAGYSQRPFCRERTAVFMGVSGSGDLGQLYGFRTMLPLFFGELAAKITDHFGPILPQWTEDSFPGILMNVAAGRIANRLDLGGANALVDAACASSLAALYLGIHEIESGGSDMALVGSADCMQNPFTYMCFSKTYALSPRGVCNSLGENADGIVLGEGAVMLVLKRLALAERDGDRIYAVIKGMGASSDGRDRSLTAPGVKGQVRALHRAYAKSGVSPVEVGLVEAHATGTVEGDKIELESLGTVYRQAGAIARSCAIGSVKSMIGHTKSSAGLASLMKATLALHHKVLPPTLGVKQPNRALAVADMPFYANVRTRPWIVAGREKRRKAAVSAFGFGGANYHAVLEEYQGPPTIGCHGPASFQQWPSELFFWHGASPEDIAAQLQMLQAQLASAPSLSLADLAHTVCTVTHAQEAAAGENRLSLALVTTSLDDLRSKLEIAIKTLAEDGNELNDPRGIYFTRTPLASSGKIAFVFPGQGSQYVHMLADLAVQFPCIRELFERTDALLEPQYDTPLSATVFPPDVFSDAEKMRHKQALADTRMAQPALGTADLALYHLLRDLNVVPDMVAGHSYGEYVALCAAGVVSEEDLILLSAARARCIVEGAGNEPGTMAAVEADGPTVAATIVSLPGVWLANLNGPQQSVLTGTPEGVQEAMARCAQQELKAVPIAVSCAFHSPLMQPACTALAHYLEQVTFHPPRLPVYSNTTAALHAADGMTIKENLVQHLVHQVRFAQQIETMYAQGARIFVEAGPGMVLSSLVRQILGERPHVAVPANLAGRSGLHQLHHLLAQLISQGVPVRIDPLNRGRRLNKLDLHNLGQASDTARLSATTWLVNGSGIRALHEKPAPKSWTPYRFVAAPSSSVPEVEAVARPEVSFFATAPATATPQAASAMGGFQSMMRQFLDTQSKVMMQFLQASNNPTAHCGHRVLPSLPEPSPSQCIEPPGRLLPRFVLRPQHISSPQRLSSLDKAKTVLITDDGQGIAVAVSDRLHALGYRTALVSSSDKTQPGGSRFLVETWDEMHVAQTLHTIEQNVGPVGSVVHLLPLRKWPSFQEMESHQWQDRLQTELRSIFSILHGCREHIRSTDQGGSVILCATSMGGSFGLDPATLSREYFPGHGALGGLGKTLALEWPETRICTVDLCLDESVEQLASAIVTECLANDGVGQVGYVGGQRQTVALIQSTEERNPAACDIDASWVILVTGGARGITATISADLARRYQPTLILAGRSPVPEQEEGAATRHLIHPHEIKRVLVEQYQKTGAPFQLADIEKECTRLLNNRTMRATIAQMRAHGATVHYHQLDVRNELAVAACLEEIYQQFGRLDGIIHGAGIIEDKLFVEKQWPSFARVVSTKTDGAFFLCRHLKPESLRFFCFFASVAGSFGNIGQCDYAAANEIQNKLALYLDRQWPQVHLFSLNWGPWAGGMASDGVQKQFQARRVELIEAADGARTFNQELMFGPKGEVEIVVGAGPWCCLARTTFPRAFQSPLPLFPEGLQPLRFDGSLLCTRMLDPATDLYLNDHRLDGNPVLPATMAVELMAEAATVGRPGWQVRAVRKIKVLKGIVLDDGPQDLHMAVSPPLHQPDTDQIECSVTISDGPKGRLFYRGTVLLARTTAECPVHLRPHAQELTPWTLPIPQVYGQWLFHGPLFQCIDRFEGHSERDMVAWLKTSQTKRCLAGAPQGEWLADPIVLDGGLQMALIWARQTLDITVLPSSFEGVELFRPLAQAEEVVCHLQVDEVLSPHSVVYSMYFTDPEGKVLALIDRIQATGSRDLNRLAGHLHRWKEGEEGES